MIDFVINHFHRAGSSYLQNLLGSHREIICLFRPFGKDLYGHMKSKDDYFYAIYGINEERIRKLSRTYLYDKDWRWIKKNIDNWDKIFSECTVGSSNVKVGVKFSFDEYHNHGDLHEYVKNTTGPHGLKVITLRRKNLLRQVYSYYRALHGNRDDWFIYEHENKKIEKKVYKLNYNWLINTFNIVERYYKKYEHLPHLRVDYEDLLDNRDEQLDRIYKYIKVEQDPNFNPVVPVQQNIYHMSEVLENFDELRNKFKGTKYYEFFE